MRTRLMIPLAAGALMFALTYLSFACLAVTVVLAFPLLLVTGFIIMHKARGTGWPVLAGLILGPLFSAETLAGWVRILQGQNPGGPNGMLVLIHGVLALCGAVMVVLVSTRQTRRDG